MTYYESYMTVAGSAAGDGLSRLRLGVHEPEDGADPEEGAAGAAHPGILRQRGDHEAPSIYFM